MDKEPCNVSIHADVKATSALFTDKLLTGFGPGVSAWDKDVIKKEKFEREFNTCACVFFAFYLR